MPTATVPFRTPAVDFALRAVAWSLGLFGFLRLSGVETHALLPLTYAQARLAIGLFGTPALPIEATLACSGADAMALCLGATLAYPARARTRLAGAAGGLALILGLNVLRIGTLGRAAASPAWFAALHLYVWPAVLMLAIAGYVFVWMRRADGQGARGDRDRERVAPRITSASFPVSFVAVTAGLLLLFVVSSPLYVESARLLAVTAFVAGAAASALGALGVPATAEASVLWTPRGGFLVTQECLATPLVPLYLGAVLVYGRTWRRRALGVVATVPLFVGLAVARLLVVALPAALVASPVFVIHAFYQLLLAAAVIAGAAVWRHGAGPAGAVRTLAGIALGVAFFRILGDSYTRLIASGASAALSGAATLPDDPQGALTLMPAFQVALYLALCLGAVTRSKEDFNGRAWLVGLVLLPGTQIATLAAIAIAGAPPHVRDIRAWAIFVPLFIAVLVTALTRRHSAGPSHAGLAGARRCGNEPHVAETADA